MKQRVEITVQAPAEETFRIFSDFGEATNHIPSITKMEYLNGSTLRPGLRVRETRIVHGREATEELEVVRLDPPREMVVKSESDGTSYTTLFTVTPVQGRCTAAMELTATPRTLPARILSFLVVPFFKGSIRKMMQSDLEYLKAAAEKKKG